MNNILITGVASGIGQACKDYFLNNNYKIIGLDVKQIPNQENLISFVADITSEESLLKVKKYLIDNNIKLDAIINIAGIHKMSSLVEDEFNKMKKVIDVNLLGTMLVNNIFHSLLDKNGRIVIVTSEVATFDPMPFNGLYNVSKTALDCYAQALRQELNLINQKVITIRPGAINTPLSQNSLIDTESLSNNTNLYKKQSNKFLGLTKKFMGTPLDPNKLAKLVYKSTTKKRPKLIYKTHRNIGLVLLNMLPIRLQCFIIKKILN